MGKVTDVARGSSARRRPAKTAADLRREIATLKLELAQSVERQTATGEILGAIAGSPGNADLVLDTIAHTATRLFQASGSTITRIDDGVFRSVAATGEPGQLMQAGLSGLRIDRNTPPGRAVLERRTIHIEDIQQQFDEFPSAPSAQRPTAVRTLLVTPLMRESEAIGTMSVRREEVRPFSAKEIALVESFADQAVIAIENARLFGELRESLDRQVATSEVLSAISSTPDQLEPIFNTMIENATRLCRAEVGTLALYDGGAFRGAAVCGHASSYADTVSRLNAPPGTGLSVMEHTMETVQVEDIAAEPAYDEIRRINPDSRRLRTALYVPIRKHTELIGAFMVYRHNVRAFDEKQVELVKSFADQAVIAIENARLLEELNTRNRDLAESLEQQTATSEILRAIASSPGDSDRVLDTIADTAQHLLNGSGAAIVRVDDKGILRRIAAAGAIAPLSAYPEARPDRGTVIGRAALEKRTVHVEDIRQQAAEFPTAPTLGKSANRTVLATPLLREGEAIGAINVLRTEVQPFTAKEIELLESFAAQAVIAIENARLLEELNTRNRDLAESLEQQTATSEILRTIASSPGDATQVLVTIARTAQRLLAASGAAIARVDDEGTLRRIATAGLAAPVSEQPKAGLNRGTPMGRAALDKRTVHVEDILQQADQFPATPALLGKSANRTILATPLLREGEAIGAINVSRTEVRPFTAKQIELLESFAAQAVIAIENARLLNELRESLERRTATAEVLAVISASPGEVEPVFKAMLENAVRLCEATEGSVFSASGNMLRRIAGHGLTADLLGLDEVQAAPASPPGRMLSTLKTVHIPDLSAMLAELPELRDTPAMAGARAVVERGARTALWVPMIKDGAVVGAFVLHRREPRPFSAAQIGLVETFANQAVIAIENARLLTELRTARDTAEHTLSDLRLAQASLIQSEKMASLGQLTAGIAHEIKNPLNFVNNFADLSIELLDELKAELADDKQPAVEELIRMLTGNLDKIAEHGGRADGIVKSMLAHSRGGRGERQRIDLNALVEESLNLAYHGARAQDQSFNVTIECDLDPSLTPIEVVPQDLTRVFLNLFGNGFYAANKRKNEAGDATYRPTMKVTTQDLGGDIAIRIRDNGTGIPPNLRPRLFQPFFTTKPTGEGTGLGLSISYEIVTKEHGGSLDVESVPGEFTEFCITIPKHAGPAAGERP